MPAVWTPAYVAIGSNLDDPPAQIALAFAALARITATRLIARSRLYVTRPLGPQDQPDFVNAAVGLLTTLTARELLTSLQDIERTRGKQTPPQRWGARRIDLDLVVFGEQVIDTPDLQVPHPGVPTRNFVLYPLLDIAPQLLIPGHGRVHDLAQRVDAAGIVPLI